MPISLHCPFCGKAIRAGDDAAGKWGSCPSCHQKVYVPNPEDEPLTLEPVDQAAERERARLLNETKELQRRLMREQSLPEDARGGPRGAAARGGEEREHAAPGVDMRKMVLNYATAMAQGRLEESEQFAAMIRRDMKTANDVIQQIIADDIPPPELAAIPRPVLIGFFKQLRG